VELGAFGQLEVVGLTSRGDHPSTGVLDVGFDRLTVVFSPWGAIRGRPDAVEKIVLVAPRLDIQLDAKPLLPSFDQGAPRPPESGPHQLPSIEIADADVRLRTKVDSLHLTGVDFRLDGTELRLDVRGAEGDWRPPRFEAVPQPIEARVRCVGSTEPWDEIALDTLSLGGREYARDLRVDLREAGVVKFYGDLPGWGARLTAGSVVGDILDLTFRGDGGDLKPIVALFTDWPVPHARATGDFRLVLPLDELKSWQASTDMELTEIRWPEYSLTALDARVTGRRGRDGLLAGEALLISVAWQGSAAVDLHGPFRVQDIGEPGGFEAAFDAGFVSPAGGRGDVAARIQEIGFVVRDGRLHIDDLSGEDLASFGLAGGLSSTVHAASLDASFDGPIAEPAAWSGRAALRAAGSHWDDGESVRASAQATLGSCVLRLDPLQVETCEVAADVRVAVSFDPARTAVFVAADELRGVIGGTSFEVGPPVVFEAAARNGGFVARLEPALAWGLGGGGCWRQAPRPTAGFRRRFTWTASTLHGSPRRGAAEKMASSPSRGEFSPRMCRSTKPCSLGSSSRASRSKHPSARPASRSSRRDLRASGRRGGPADRRGERISAPPARDFGRARRRELRAARDGAAPVGTASSPGRR
jgi:hypothetical protein